MVKAADLFMSESFTGVVSCSLALCFKSWCNKKHETGGKGGGFKNKLLKLMLESMENFTTVK